MPSYMPSSTRLGSTMIRRTSSGVALYRIDMIMELIMTLLPDPVEPAISRCGMDSSAATRMRPLMSLPSGIVRCECEPRELVRLQHLPQRDHLAARVRHFDADGRLAGDALDQDRFGLQAEAQVLA